MDISLRPINDYLEHDTRFLYTLLEERPQYACISHKSMPTYEEHCGFVRSRPYHSWYMIHGPLGVKCGCIYLTDRHEIGIFVLREVAGRGIGKAAIKELMRLHPGIMFLANISPTNEISKKLFTSLGFKIIQETYASAQSD